MIKHRRVFYKHTRVKLPQDYEEKIHDIQLSGIRTVVGKNEDGYLCVLKNGSVEARELKDDNEHVKEYTKNVLNDTSLRSNGIPDTQMSEWADLCLDLGVPS